MVNLFKLVKKKCDLIKDALMKNDKIENNSDTLNTALKIDEFRLKFVKHESIHICDYDFCNHIGMENVEKAVAKELKIQDNGTPISGPISRRISRD